MKIRTLGHLQDCLDKEMGWRLKEVADLKTSVKSSKLLSQSTLIRAGVAILYAHWEGFIKSSSLAYVEYLNSQKICYYELKAPFVVMGMKSHLNTLRESGSYEGNMSALSFLTTKMSERFNVDFSGAVNTESNLSSTVFFNIASSLCISHAPYEAKANLIDESLLKRRNKIAHGEYLDIDSDEWRNLADEVLVLLRSYKTDVENAATMMSYRA